MSSILASREDIQEKHDRPLGKGSGLKKLSNVSPDHI